MPDKYEQFVAAFLRLNGYFTVPNFIVHAGDDPSRISGGAVGNHTEIDTIAVRMPFSTEIIGTKTVENFGPLVNGSNNRLDIVFAEAKSGEAKPNKVWIQGHPDPAISYMVRFIGLDGAAHIGEVAGKLAATYRYEDGASRYRYVIFASTTNDHYSAKGVTYITFREAIEFLVHVRGQSWMRANLGLYSVHQQWDELLKDLFAMANDETLTLQERVVAIENYLAS